MRFDQAMDEMADDLVSIKKLREEEASRNADILREKHRSEEVAQSIAGPYLRDLGPRVVRRLFDLGIQPQEIYLHKHQSIRGWRFHTAHSQNRPSDIEDTTYGHGFTMLSHDVVEGGRQFRAGDCVDMHTVDFGSLGLKGSYSISPLFCSLRTLDQARSDVHSSGILKGERGVNYGPSLVFADPESKGLYVIAGRRTWNTEMDYIQELGLFIAKCIRFEMI